MKLIDPTIELVACGSSNSRMPTFGQWEATVLEHCYADVDYISLHTYYDPGTTDRASLLASAVDMDAFIDAVVATADHVRAKGRHRRRLRLSFDEWNVWYESRLPQDLDRGWTAAPPLIEDTFTAMDAVVVGDLLITLLRHADRVGVACQAQLANVIGPIRTITGGPAWRQTIFHPFALTARHARGSVLRTEPRSPTYETSKYGEVPVLDLTAVHDEDTVTVFAVNRGDEDLRLDLDLRALPAMRPVEHLAIEADREATNTAEAPDRVVPRRLVTTDDAVRLPAMSWNLVRLATPTAA
jgi:alpha-N-arabinofuranosidase